MFGDQRLPRRLWDKIRISSNGCWEWTGCCNSAGYGQIRVNNQRWYTHRLVFTTTRGAIPEDLEMDHLCRNPPCCNPDHLEPVTRRENNRRGLGGPRKTCPHGHPYDDNNTYRRPDTGKRQCLACNMARNERKVIDRRAAGLCLRCGSERDDESVHCSKCRLRHARNAAKSRRRAA